MALTLLASVVLSGPGVWLAESMILESGRPAIDCREPFTL